MIPFREVDSIQYVVCELSDIGEVFSRYDPPAVAVGLTAMEFEAFVRLFSPDLEGLREQILIDLKLGKQPPAYKAAQKALHRFPPELTSLLYVFSEFANSVFATFTPCWW